MKSIHLFLTPFLLLSLTACNENPVSHDDGEEEEVTVAFQMSEDDIHTLDQVTFTAAVSSDHGDPVTNFEEVGMQYRLEGSNEWSDLVMNLSGTDYSGTMMFLSSGQYEVRVMGRHQGHGDMETMHVMAEHLEVGRAHEDVGVFRIEYENFPGEIHEGDTAAIQFWIMEDSPARTPITGIQAEIHYEDPSGAEESHDAVESEPGVYRANHTFQLDGEAHLAIHFPGIGGVELDAEFHIPISSSDSHGH